MLDLMVRETAPEIRQLEQKYAGEKIARNFQIISTLHTKQEQAVQDFENTRGREIQMEIEQVRSVTLAKIKAELIPIPLIPFWFDVARDAEGKGWIGSIESEVLANCNEIQFISAQGFTTEKLPPITGQIALERAASKDVYLPTPTAQAYWLHIAEQYTDEKDFLLLGQVYDDQGRRESQNYVRAVQYYRAVLKKGEDARAQKPLARLYAEGLGTPKDPVEAQRLNQLADRTNAPAEKACASPQSIVAIKSMLTDLYKPLKTELLSSLLKKPMFG